jgi:peptide/nickel transport system substrate-binding protein
MLGDAGLRVRTTPLDFGVLLERLDAGDFDLALLQIPELTEPNLLAWFFHRAGVPGEGGAGRNRARYRSAHASALLDEASRLAERPARARAYAELAEVMLEDMPVVPLWHEDHVAIVSARARSFVPSAEGRWASIAGVP